MRVLQHILNLTKRNSAAQISGAICEKLLMNDQALLQHGNDYTKIKIKTLIKMARNSLLI